MFKGSLPALVTPMRNGSIDEDAFRDLVRAAVAANAEVIAQRAAKKRS